MTYHYWVNFQRKAIYQRKLSISHVKRPKMDENECLKIWMLKYLEKFKKYFFNFIWKSCKIDQMTYHYWVNFQRKAIYQRKLSISHVKRPKMDENECLKIWMLKYLEKFKKYFFNFIWKSCKIDQMSYHYWVNFQRKAIYQRKLSISHVKRPKMDENECLKIWMLKYLEKFKKYFFNFIWKSCKIDQMTYHYWVNFQRKAIYQRKLSISHVKRPKMDENECLKIWMLKYLEKFKKYFFNFIWKSCKIDQMTYHYWVNFQRKALYQRKLSISHVKRPKMDENECLKIWMVKKLGKIQKIFFQFYMKIM